MNFDSRRRGRGDPRGLSKQKLGISAEEELESKLGFVPFTEGDKRLGWLLTLTSSSWEDEDTNKIYSCVDLYFVTQAGSTFKAKYKFRPYFYAATKDKMELEVDAYLRRRYESEIANIEIVDKEDLSLRNHLSGLCRSYLKISFDAEHQLMHVKNDLLDVVERNHTKLDTSEALESIYSEKSTEKPQDYLDCIIVLCEYDVPYHVRFAIDIDIRCGQWYDVSVSSAGIVLEKRADLLQRAEVHVCAFDIETTKQPLKFPDAEYDIIIMISYMIDGQGYLIINRECVRDDIEDLEYTPKPEFKGCFKVRNVKDEIELLRVWFDHMRKVKPGIYVTYNGDFFDWPFLEKRAAHHGIQMIEEIGFRYDQNQGECRAKFSCHLDCFAWVKRDSYLPHGSQGLKAVTKAKLGYDLLEVNPEDMVRFAMEQPQLMASYSVSDAVATYYLYMTYVHPFIFSLATIIPMPPDEVLRKGSGTLCEMLLMVQAHKANIICPNKHQADPEKFYNNRLLESKTYIGGHVECLESWVFRSDLPTRFQPDPSAFEGPNSTRPCCCLISDDGIPDLGGNFEGDSCFADEVNQPCLTYPGAYRKIVVELKIHHMAVNALLKSSQVDEMEGGSLLGYDHDMHSGSLANDVDYDEAGSSFHAFRVLKQLIQRCIADAFMSGNVFANEVLKHLYRCLCSPLSKLHDPALHHLLHKVMRKVFALLLAELRKLGATIIFANFSKIIIDTGKMDFSAGHAYCDCLLKTLQTRDLFEWIELEPIHYWHSLLFMDQYNYGGIEAKSLAGYDAEAVVNESEVGIVSSWDIAQCLPKITQDHFLLIISEFLYNPWKYLREQVAIRMSTRDENTGTQSITIKAAETLEACVTEHLKDQISNYFTAKLLRIVDTLHHAKRKNRIEIEDQAIHASQHAAAHLFKGDAALEFIKHVCAVLALDLNVQHDVLRMRKNLLKLIRVKEFSLKVQFHDQRPTFILPNVICSYCGDCRELDLCGDSALMEQEWRCAVPQCGQPYNREQMEKTLFQIV